MLQTEHSGSFSLLEPEGEHVYFTLNARTAHDLGVDFIAQHAAGQNEQHILQSILLRMPADTEVIRYRQAVYQDLKAFPELCTSFYEIFDRMRFFSMDAPKLRNADIWELLDYFKALENYTASVTAIKEALEGKRFRSEGMQAFCRMMDTIHSDSGFHALAEDIAGLAEDVSVVRSMTIGVNFDSEFRPAEVGIISLNEYAFTEQGLLEKFIRFHKKREPSDKLLTSFVTIPHKESDTLKADTGSTLMMKTLTSVIEEMLPDMISRLRRILKKYTNTSGTALTRLADEFLFYLRMIGLERRLTEAGMPCCMPACSESGTELTDFYNLRLALCRLAGIVEHEIVCNTLSFAPKQEILILTGPNRGGKTIFTQGIGLAFLLFQSGVFAPCRTGQIRICDGIYTHFPADENLTVSLGRLGEEAERFSEICCTATPQSLLLFNESFSTTSHSESLYIAADVLKYLCCLGARTCFNTHMHELAAHAAQLAPEYASGGAVSVVMGKRDGSDAYKIAYGNPDGKSYAREIASQYGITFEQLCQHLQ